MKRALGAMLVTAVMVSACATPEDQARQRCAGAANVADCVRADQERQRAAEQREMDDRNQMGGNMGGY